MPLNSIDPLGLKWCLYAPNAPGCTPASGDGLEGPGDDFTVTYGDQFAYVPGYTYTINDFTVANGNAMWAFGISTAYVWVNETGTYYSYSSGPIAANNSSWGWNFTKAFFGGLVSKAGWKAVYNSFGEGAGGPSLRFFARVGFPNVNPMSFVF
jgi:hypothetical protein